MHALVLVGVQHPVAFELFRVPRTTPRKRRYPARRKATVVFNFEGATERGEKHVELCNGDYGCLYIPHEAELMMFAPYTVAHVNHFLEEVAGYPWPGTGYPRTGID